jgi:putative peptidoglycan lipid II flippase
VGTAVFASRILGLIREQIFAIFFGAGFAYDAFVVAYRIPNLLRELFAEGALSSAFVTVFTDCKIKKGTEATQKLANNVITTIIIIVGIICAAGMYFSSDIVSYITTADYSKITGKLELTTLMTSIMFPFLLLVSLSAVAMGILNTFGKFFLPALSSSFFNLGSIVSGVILSIIAPKYGFNPIVGMACGVVFGGMLQIIIQLPSLIKQGFIYRPRLNFSDPDLRRIMKLMVPAIIGLAPLQITVLINTFFASGCEQGSLSWLTYAYRVLWFPIGIVGVSLSVATLPVVSRHASNADMGKLKEAYVSSTVLCIILAVPATLGLIFLSGPIIRVIFEYGNFTAADTSRTAIALSLYAIGLLAFSAQKIIVPVFYALDKARYPVIGSLITIFLNIIVVITTLDSLQFKAIALSVSLCITANFIFLSFMLYKNTGGYDAGRIIKCFLKVFPLSVVMGAAAWWIDKSINNLMGEMLFSNLISLTAAILTGIIIYGALINLLNIKEISTLRNKLLSMIPKKRNN